MLQIRSMPHTTHPTTTNITTIKKFEGLEQRFVVVSYHLASACVLLVGVFQSMF